MFTICFTICLSRKMPPSTTRSNPPPHFFPPVQFQFWPFEDRQQFLSEGIEMDFLMRKVASLTTTPKSSDGAAACGCEEAANELDLSANTTMTGNDASLLDESAEATKASSSSPAQTGVPYAQCCVVCMEDGDDRWEESNCVNMLKEPNTCGNWVCNICSAEILSGNLDTWKFCYECESIRCPDCDSKKLRSERGDCECEDCRFECACDDEPRKVPGLCICCMERYVCEDCEGHVDSCDACGSDSIEEYKDTCGWKSSDRMCSDCVKMELGNGQMTTCPDCFVTVCEDCSVHESRGTCECNESNFGHKYADMDPQWYHGGVDGSYWAQFGGKFGSTKPSKKKEKPVFDEVEEAYTRYLVKDDGQEEGGFNLSDVRALRQSTEGWIISYTTMNDVDVKTGSTLYLCVCCIQEGPVSQKSNSTHVPPGMGCIPPEMVGWRIFTRKPTGMDATIVIDNAMYRPLVGSPRRPEWLLVANRFGQDQFREIQGQMMYRSVYESVFQPSSAAAESCAKYNTDLAGSNHPKSNRKVSCASCGRIEEVQGKHKRCSACKAVHYCSETCQKAHWKKHKKSCKAK